MKIDYVKNIRLDCFWKKFSFIFKFPIFSLQHISKVNDTLSYLKQSCKWSSEKLNEVLFHNW